MLVVSLRTVGSQDKVSRRGDMNCALGCHGASEGQGQEGHRKAREAAPSTNQVRNSRGPGGDTRSDPLRGMFGATNNLYSSSTAV